MTALTDRQRRQGVMTSTNRLRTIGTGAAIQLVRLLEHHLAAANSWSDTEIAVARVTSVMHDCSGEMSWALMPFIRACRGIGKRRLERS